LTVFAHTNDDVDFLNADIRKLREQRGELGEPHSFETKHGRAEFAAYDRLQFTGTDKARGYTNGATGTVLRIIDDKLIVALDRTLWLRYLATVAQKVRRTVT
jgi:ATP-dependent exoDNAse (exonuclease V) alpha subunit